MAALSSRSHSWRRKSCQSWRCGTQRIESPARLGAISRPIIVPRTAARYLALRGCWTRSAGPGCSVVFQPVRREALWIAIQFNGHDAKRPPAGGLSVALIEAANQATTNAPCPPIYLPSLSINLRRASSPSEVKRSFSLKKSARRYPVPSRSW
jgi:hypothetical protein